MTPARTDRPHRKRGGRGSPAAVRLCKGWIVLAMLVWAVPAQAADGAIEWRSLRHPDVDVHYPSQLEDLARRALDTLIDAQRTLGPLLSQAHRPRLQLTIDDYSDSANGFATVVPYDRVHLQAYPPDPGSELGDHGDWVRALLFHEYAHILHMGEVSGLPDAANHVLGRVWLPNGLMPRFFLEGLATWAETRHTGADRAVAGRGGRIDSPAYLALLRAAVLDDTVPDLNQLSGQPLRWPRGGGWYLYGSLLLDDLAKHYGDDKIKEFIRVYGSRTIPFGVQGTSRQVFGKSLTRLWRDSVEQLQARVQAEVRAVAGFEVTSPEQLARWVAASDGARLTTDGELRGRLRPWGDGLWVVGTHAPADGRARIVRIQGVTGAQQVLHLCELDCDEAMATPDGKWLLFTESRRTDRLYQWRELLALPLRNDAQGRPHAQGPALQLTRGMRLRDPSLDPTGSLVTFVTVREGRTQIRQLDLAQALQQAQGGLPPPDAALRVDAPKFADTLGSPVVADDGRLYWTQGAGANRLLWSATLTSGATGLADAPQAHRLRVRPGDPLLRPAGGDFPAVSWLNDLQVFRRQGHFWLGAVVQVGSYRDAAALDLVSPQAEFQLATRTLTGIASAAHLGDVTLTTRHHGHGLEVYRAPEPGHADATVAAAVALPAQDTPSTLERLDPASLADNAYAPTSQLSLSRPYSPWPTLYPRAWKPILLATGDDTDPMYGGLWLGAATWGRDALELTDWNLAAQLRNDGSDPMVWGGFGVSRWEPRYDLSFAYSQGNAWYRRGFRWFSTPTHRTAGRLGAAWSIPGVRDSWTVDGGWRVVETWLRNEDFDRGTPHDPGGPVPVEPWTGTDGLLDLGLSWGAAEAYADSFTAESLHYVSGRATVGHAWLGGVRERLLLAATTRHHWPLGHHRVLTLAGRLDLAPVGPDDGATYSVTGQAALDPLVILGGGSSGSIVRGLPTLAGALGGDGLAWGSLSLQWPLADIGRGLDVLPVYAGRVWLAGFVDGAYAFWSEASDRLPGGGVGSLGLELKMDYELAYIPFGVLRLGAGRAFGAVSGSQVYLSVGL